jgi:hypothetical protein
MFARPIEKTGGEPQGSGIGYDSTEAHLSREIPLEALEMLLGEKIIGIPSAIAHSAEVSTGIDLSPEEMEEELKDLRQLATMPISELHILLGHTAAVNKIL